MKVKSAVAVFMLQAGLAALPLCAAQAPALRSPARAAAQNPLVALEEAAKEKAAETAIESLLNNQLPLTLNANNVYPTVETLPGGPFSPTPLKLTADQLNQPLPPGDYTINTLAFCSEYSVHAPGAGVAYVLGPYEGKAAGAIGALIWRGTVQYHVNPNSLQAVSWAIQSGLTYAQMPKTYQGIIDQVIPDYKSEIAGDFMVNLQTTYNNAAKTAKLPPLDTILVKLGKPGELALSAERQRAILTRQNTNDQIRDQTLFQGQQSGLYTPVKAENGPWTERIKGQVYMKLQIVGGNMATNNVMMIRVMPPPANAVNATVEPHLVLAKYGESQAAAAGDGSGASVTDLMQGTIGYSQGRGAQALGQVPVVSPGSPQPPPPVLANNPAPQQNACPQPRNPSNKPLNVSFTSYTSAISNEELAEDYLGLYDAGLNSNGAAAPDSFADRMNQVAAKGVPVTFVVVDGDDPRFANFQQLGQLAYVNAQASDPTILMPNPDEYAMTFPIPQVQVNGQVQGGGYEVVISQQALMNGYYNSNSPTNNSGQKRNDLSVPLPVPIQMPMAYELGTNVFNRVIPKIVQEQMRQPDTNRFISAEFPRYATNSSPQSGSGVYGNVVNPCQTFHAPAHGIYDLQNPNAFVPDTLGGSTPADIVPANSYYNASCLSGKVATVYIPPSPPPVQPKPTQCPAAQ